MTVSLFTRPLLDRAPPWALSGAALDFDFVRHRYFQQRRPSNIESLLTTSRASIGYIDYQNGIWRPIAANLPRISDKGLLIEEARTNDAQWSRDMTQAAWVKVNMTAAKTATGIDGILNSASTLTATGTNATILQTITLGSQADTYSVWLKRISGSGVVDITLDNGVTLTPVSLTNVWTRFSAQKTAANPIFGIKIITSGDVIAADFNQLEPGGFPTSPILTTTVAVTRAADSAQANFSAVNSSTALAAFTPNAPNTYATVQTVFTMSVGGSGANIYSIRRATETVNLLLVEANSTAIAGIAMAGIPNINQGALSKISFAVSTASQRAAADGVADTNAYTQNPTTGYSTINIGSDVALVRLLNGYVSRVTLFNSLQSAAIQATLTS